MRIFTTLGDNRINIVALVEQLRTTGGVIPFIGAGMSVPFGFPGWKDFLLSMTEDKSVKKRMKARLAKGEYEEAANGLHQLYGSNPFQDAIEFTFGPGKPAVYRGAHCCNTLLTAVASAKRVAFS